jgi:RNA polymerase sigma-70 factor (ECF subfamily)
MSMRAGNLQVNDSRGSEDLEHAAMIFAEVRPRLFGIAYRMLGSSTEAEDLVQDVWVRWQTCDRSTVENPAAYLATATTRLAINASQSARVRRETYIGQWLPEPVDTSADPHLGASAVRQLVSRARKHVASERRAPVTGAEQRRLLKDFVTAAQSGDLPCWRTCSPQMWSGTPMVVAL